jgi:hypothetical protein
MPAIWTYPITWTTDQLVTAAAMNQHLRDNLEFLRAPPLVAMSATLSGNTSSDSFVDAHAQLRQTVTTQGGRVLVAVSGSPRNEFAGNNTVDFRIYHATLGALTQTHYYFDSQYRRAGVCLIALTAELTPGAHEFRVQWSTIAGRTVSLTGRWAMFVMEV